MMYVLLGLHPLFINDLFLFVHFNLKIVLKLENTLSNHYCLVINLVHCLYFILLLEFFLLSKKLVF